MSRKLLMSKSTPDYSEEGLLIYYLASRHGTSNSRFDDLSGNNNTGYIYGSSRWDPDGLVFLNSTSSGTKLTTPVSPARADRDFKLEFLLNNISKGSYAFATICTCRPANDYNAGLHCSVTHGGSYSTLYIEMNGCTLKTTITASEDNLKIIIERKGSYLYAYVNDVSLGSKQMSSYYTNELLTFGPANMSINYVKYYEF